MYLKSLTLRGFKSFAATTTLAFEPGITCVVGPNGSGKSNVVDALSWVMGEQGAKTLRGGKMEDVIFAGTSKRAPLGRAEVVLTIDNSDGALPIDYTEVTISRTMFRSGGSEYAINGNSARLLDVQELLSDSGIGREMHVIVGQGQLDSILNATPELRRSFIEEAAGVLKHRKRKEKAQRKLDATAANLNRLQDLLAELRRQLKPLGRQAEVARRAASVQAEVFDAKARLLADDYLQAQTAFDSEQAAASELKERRSRLETALARSRSDETLAEQAISNTGQQLTKTQEVWYALAGLRERVSATAAIAAERMRNANSSVAADRPGRDPQAIELEAANIRQAEKELSQQLEQKATALESASAALQEAVSGHTEAEDAFNTQQRAIADRREGLVRLNGEVNTLESRVESVTAEIARLTLALSQAQERAAQTDKEYDAVAAKLAGLTAGDAGLAVAHESAVATATSAQEQFAKLQVRERELVAAEAAASARLEVLSLSMQAKDAAAVLLSAGDELGALGSITDIISVTKGDESAIAAALGAVADAVAVTNVAAAIAAVRHLKDNDLGQAVMLLEAALDGADRSDRPALPVAARHAIDAVTTPARWQGTLQRLLENVALVPDAATASEVISRFPQIRAVTPQGDIFSSWFVSGGSATKASSLEVQAAVEEAAAALVTIRSESEQLAAQLSKREVELRAAQEQEAAALAKVNEANAMMAALSEQVNSFKQMANAAQAESGRLQEAIDSANLAKTAASEQLALLRERLEKANAQGDLSQADPTARDAWAKKEYEARAAEMDARLALRTLEERVRALQGRADSLERAAVAERDARAKAAQRAEMLRQEALVAQGVGAAAQWLTTQILSSLAVADAARSVAQQKRDAAERELAQLRSRSRELAKEFEGLVDSVHRDEMARAAQQMRLEQLTEKAMTELGYEPAALLAEFGPDQLIESSDPEVAASEYVRTDQEKRLRAAERDLAILGKVNPLALEEFEAMTERHGYLAEQLEDLRKSRADLIAMIEEVDAHMEQVFMEAYEDVKVEFAKAFDRLFPGGEGSLLLTEPDQWLTTGVEVAARPAGKKVKRLSLLSGGERSLVAVAFLVALFKARPSPFYILDEVEAALDDVNLSRLLQIYEELRDDSQLLVITHQKRTMEIADALYGITMGAEGISTVISQRLRDE